MRHVFIINPAAGKKSPALSFISTIKEVFSELQEEYVIRTTSCQGDATKIAAEEAAKGDTRLYAVGGDGTLLEVASGVEAYPDAELTVIPCGSGNDYVKSYGGAENFLNLRKLVAGTAKKVDGIRCNNKVSLNLCSIGMDADVCYHMTDFKKMPLISGPLAYDLAVLKVLLRPIGSVLDVAMETTKGLVKRSGRYLFALAANGQYYGGGYHGAPMASTEDGLLDFILIKSVPRLKAITLLGKYKRGEHMDLDICEHFVGTAMDVHCDGGACVNADGEIEKGEDTRFEIVPKYFNFVVPKA